MYGFELVESLTEKGHHLEVAALGGPQARRITVRSVSELVRIVAELNGQARRARIVVILAHTVHQNWSGNDWVQLVNVEHLMSNYHEAIDWYDHTTWRSLSVPVFDAQAQNGNGWSTDLLDTLAADIETLYEQHWIDDSVARDTVEAELITDNWDRWIESELAWNDDTVEHTWDQLSTEAQRKVFDDGLARLACDHDWHPEFESRGDNLVIDLGMLTTAMTAVLSGRTDTTVPDSIRHHDTARHDAR